MRTRHADHQADRLIAVLSRYGLTKTEIMGRFALSFQAVERRFQRIEAKGYRVEPEAEGRVVKYRVVRRTDGASA